MQMNRTKKNQSGAALITCLALLLVLTLIGLSSMTTTTLEEKMTGSVYNKQMSFQSAESVLREAESYVTNTISPNSITPGSETGFYDYRDPSSATYPVWDWNAGNDDNGWYATNAATTLPTTGTAYQPSYIIEYNSPYMENPINCPLNEPIFENCITHINYRITARSQGLNNRADTILQSTFRVRK